MKILHEYTSGLRKYSLDANDKEALQKEFSTMDSTEIEQIVSYLRRTGKEIIFHDCYDPQSGWQGKEVILDNTDFSVNGYCFSKQKLLEYISQDQSVTSSVPASQENKQMKTREEVEALKRNWQEDPCWDIEETEGFEEYREELLRFRKECQEKAEAIYQKEREKGIRNSLVQLYRTDVDYGEYCGLTKRELFTAMAMQGFIQAGYFSQLHEGIEAMVKYAVKCADAILTELNKPE